MDSFVAIPMLACVVSSVVATRTWLSEPDNRQLWPLAGLSALGALWAFCEVLWNQADTAQSALFWARASALGTVPLGPMALHALAVGGDRNSAELRGRLPWFYVACAAFIAAGWFTEGLVSNMVETWWGWSPEYGWLILVQYSSILACVAVGIATFRGERDLEQIHLGPLVIASAVFPLVLATVTDVVLPLMHIHGVPRLGSTSLALVGALQTYLALRNGEESVLPEGVTAAVLRALPDGVVSLTPGGIVRSANDRFAELAGPGRKTWLVVGSPSFCPTFSRVPMHPAKPSFATSNLR